MLRDDGRGVFFGTAALFSLALALGGLGPHAPLLVALIEAAAFPLLVALALSGRTRSIARPDCVVAILFLLLLLAIGASQLVPLPASLWHRLPGREVVTIVGEVAGQGNQARPLSLAPETTRLVVQSWLPPITLFLATMMATRSERGRLPWLVILAAAISSLLGLLQLSFGDGTLFLDPGGISNRYPGLFANYNHQGAFLAAAVALLPAMTSEDRHRGSWGRWWPLAFWVLALVGTLITSSRAGLALFALSSLVTAARMFAVEGFAKQALGRDRRRTLALIGATFVMLAAVVWVVAGGYRGQLMSSRFEAVSADARYEFWRTTLAGARGVFPVGAGFGTFETTYQLIEPLDQVHAYLVNHAHNDYLELALEAGAGGILLLVVFVAWFGTRLTGLARRQSGRDPAAWGGATIVILVMLHSLVDYPLRTEAIGCLFAFACALLLPPPDDRTSRARARTPGRSPGVVV